MIWIKSVIILLLSFYRDNDTYLVKNSIKGALQILGINNNLSTTQAEKMITLHLCLWRS